MSLPDLLENWRASPTIAGNITAWRTLPSRPAETAPWPPDLHPALTEALRARGITELYVHQVAAWEHIRAGRQPVIVTGTASGKSLCYNLPVLDRLLRRPDSRALYLFPTKALAQDQAASLRQLITPCLDNSDKNSQCFAAIHNSQFIVHNSPFTISTYDGDTPPSLRPAIRQHVRLLITNPDMLHTGILPHHTRWADFFHSLQFIVIDEMHSYRGVFGSHVANVLRRCRRIARFYGASPQFIFTSATITNPTELAGQLSEEDVVLVDHDGAPRGAKHFLIYNPPLVNHELGLRRSALSESVRLAQDLLAHNLQTIIFARARRTVEILLNYLQSTIPAGNPAQGAQVRGYRSGYLPRQRREIEAGLRAGHVRAVAATSALELGVDIGQMAAAVLAGYPGTIAGTWQQAGRAGRQTADSLAVLVTSAGPLDQFLAHQPAYFFERPVEQALINPDNLLILWQHLRCAAFELPFQRSEAFGRVDAGLVTELLELLRQSGELHLSADKYFWMAEHYPAEQISLRSASPERVLLQAAAVEGWQTIGEVDRASAPWLVHPQAIYLHDGESYLVESLDLAQNIAQLRPFKVDYFTEPQRETSVALIESQAEAEVRGGTKVHGDLRVTTQVTGFRRIKWFTQEHLGEGTVTLPPTEISTTGYWLTLAPATVERLRAEGLWSNDPNDYGPNWPGQRDKARARDGYRCQICGVAEQGRTHDVHHKIPFRRFDSYQQANQLANLVTLCRSCHRQAEIAVRMRSGLAGLAFALGHLAPLLLMCDANDVAVHAEPKLAWAADRPAVIIYELAPGGVGLSEHLFELHHQLISQAYQLVNACGCVEGCPSCVGPAGEEGAGGKRQTLAILEVLAEGEERGA